MSVVSDPRDYGRVVTITCQGRALLDGECVGEICGRTISAPQTWALDRARAAGWRVGKRADGTPDAMCERCAKPDPELVRILRSLT